MTKLIALLMFSATAALADTQLSSSALNLKPATLPACTLNGQLRVDASFGLSICDTGSWVALGVPALTDGSVLFANGSVIGEDNNNFFYNSTLHALGLDLSGANPQGLIDVGVASVQTVAGVTSGLVSLNDLTSANNPPSGVNSFEDTGGTGYTANGTSYCYNVWTYTTLNAVNFGSGPGSSCFGDTNDGATFSAQTNWSPGGGLSGQVMVQSSPSNIVEAISAGQGSFTDSNDMVNNFSTPNPVSSYAYHSDGTALNITYSVYSYRYFSGVKTYTQSPFAIVTTDPNDGGWYIPFISWTASAGAAGYKVIRSTDGLVVDVSSSTSLYDSSAFVSWSGANAVTPDSYTAPSIRSAGDVVQSSDAWAIHTDGSFHFISNIHADSGGTLYTNSLIASGINTAGGGISLGGGTLSGANISIGSGTFSNSGQVTLSGLTLYAGGANMQFDVFGTGTKIGTGTNQMIAFFGGTPHVQPTGNILTALGSAGLSLIGSPVLPNPSFSTLGGTQSKGVVSSQWLTGISTSGVVTASQPAFTDISGTIPTSQLTNAGSAFLQGFTGLLTSITSNGVIGYGKLPRAITLQNIQGIALGTFTCAANPTITLQDCGTSAGACTSGVTNKAAVTVTGTTGVDGSIINAGIAAGHYWAFQFTAGTCTTADLSVSAQYTMQ